MKHAVLILSFLLCWPSSAFAHEARPAYLEIKEITPNRFDVLWRIPLNAGIRPPVALKFPDNVRNVTEPSVRELPDSLLERRLIETPAGGLAGGRIEFAGLEATTAEVLVRGANRDGTQWTTLVRPSQPWFEPAVHRSKLSVAGAYTRIGIKHILGGIDHLLYILAMLFLVKGWRRIVATMTAFTVTHSLTLTAAALGFVHIPQPPVEAAIALSILFVAREIVLARQGRPGLMQRWPWVVSFTFGLLHGFGFAGALSEVGLPQHAIPVALLFFNVGVEIGQLLFIAAVFIAWAAARQMASRLAAHLPQWVWRLPLYAIGSVAAFWFIQRVAMF